MVARLEKAQEGYTIRLTDEMVEELRLSEGSSVQVFPLTETVDEPRAQIRYATVDEVIKIHREMEPYHAAAYRELAK